MPWTYNPATIGALLTAGRYEAGPPIVDIRLLLREVYYAICERAAAVGIDPTTIPSPQIGDLDAIALLNDWRDKLRINIIPRYWNIGAGWWTTAAAFTLQTARVAAGLENQTWYKNPYLTPPLNPLRFANNVAVGDLVTYYHFLELYQVLNVLRYIRCTSLMSLLYKTGSGGPDPDWDMVLDDAWVAATGGVVVKLDAIGAWGIYGEASSAEILGIDHYGIDLELDKARGALVLDHAPILSPLFLASLAYEDAKIRVTDNGAAFDPTCYEDDEGVVDTDVYTGRAGAFPTTWSFGTNRTTLNTSSGHPPYLYGNFIAAVGDLPNGAGATPYVTLEEQDYTKRTAWNPPPPPPPNTNYWRERVYPGSRSQTEVFAKVTFQYQT